MKAPGCSQSCKSIIIYEKKTRGSSNNYEIVVEKSKHPGDVQRVDRLISRVYQ